MSIGLLLKYPDTYEDARLVPVAAEEIFETYWLPASKLLGLQWVPIFQSGLPVSREDIPYILGELDLLKEFMTSEPLPQLPTGVAEHIVERIDLLTAELSVVQNSPDLEAYIG